MSDFFTRIQIMLVALLSGTSAKGMLATSPARSKAVTFIEYAILAAIAVFIGILFRSQLSALFNTLFGRLNSQVNT